MYGRRVLGLGFGGCPHIIGLQSLSGLVAKAAVEHDFVTASASRSFEDPHYTVQGYC